MLLDFGYLQPISFGTCKSRLGETVWWWPHGGDSEQSEIGEKSEMNKMIWFDGRLMRLTWWWTYRTDGMSTQCTGGPSTNQNWDEEIMLSKSENFTKILKINKQIYNLFTNSVVLRPVSFASFQYQQAVPLDEPLYQLVLFPEILHNIHYIITIT